MSEFAKTEAGRNYALSVPALKRLAQPDDMAAWSPDVRWITGDTVRVEDGSKL